MISFVPHRPKPFGSADISSSLLSETRGFRSGWAAVAKARKARTGGNERRRAREKNVRAPEPPESRLPSGCGFSSTPPRSEASRETRNSRGSRGLDARAAYLLVQPEAMRLVRSVHDVLQVFPHELEELLEHLLNLGLLERPHDAPGSRAPRRASSRAWAADWVARKTTTRPRSRDLVGERAGYARSRVRRTEAAAVRKCRRRSNVRPIPAICGRFDMKERGETFERGLRALIPCGRAQATMAAAGIAGGRITAGAGSNLLGQQAADRNQDATVYVGNLDLQVRAKSGNKPSPKSEIRTNDRRGLRGPIVTSAAGRTALVCSSSSVPGALRRCAIAR